MSFLLKRLHDGWSVDQAIVTEKDKLVVIHFGYPSEFDCILMEEYLYKIAEYVKNFAKIYAVDIEEVPDFTDMYELFKKVNLMFFYRNKHVMIDTGTGDNNKITWPIVNKDELIEIIETVYRGASKGKGLVVSTKDYSTKVKK